MKLTAAKVEAFIRRPDPGLKAVLVYGPDSGLVRERADAVARHVAPDLGDPFRVAELGPAQLKDDPARLADEAAALSMTGGRRVVRVRPATDAQAELLEQLLAAPAGDALVVVEAGELGPRSPLRRLFEGAAGAAALPCYRDDEAGLERVIGATLSAQGFTVEPAALDFLVATLGNDRLVTRSELDKLATYMGSERRITLAAAQACVGDASLVTLESLALAACGGDLGRVERGLAQAYREGVAPVSILRAVAKHLARLHRAAGLVARGETPERVIASFRPRLHFTVAKALRRQIARWPGRRVVEAMDALLEAELRCKTTGAPAEAVCSRMLLVLATKH